MRPLGDPYEFFQSEVQLWDWIRRGIPLEELARYRLPQSKHETLQPAWFSEMYATVDQFASHLADNYHGVPQPGLSYVLWQALIAFTRQVSYQKPCGVLPNSLAEHESLYPGQSFGPYSAKDAEGGGEALRFRRLAVMFGTLVSHVRDTLGPSSRPNEPRTSHLHADQSYLQLL